MPILRMSFLADLTAAGYLMRTRVLLQARQEAVEVPAFCPLPALLEVSERLAGFVHEKFRKSFHGLYQINAKDPVGRA